MNFDANITQAQIVFFLAVIAVSLVYIAFYKKPSRPKR